MNFEAPESQTDRGELLPRKKAVKCVVVGDRAVGKTSLIISYTKGTFPAEYVPTAFDNYNVIVNVNDEPIHFQICDTSGQDNFSKLRSLCYPETDVFMLCFSIVEPETFRSASLRWLDELMLQESAVVLVGTQCDLAVAADRETTSKSVIRKEEAVDLARKLNAVYIETSALTAFQLKEAFDQAIILAMQKSDRAERDSDVPLCARCCNSLWPICCEIICGLFS